MVLTLNMVQRVSYYGVKRLIWCKAFAMRQNVGYGAKRLLWNKAIGMVQRV